MLSERAKNWLVGPKALISVVAIVGFIRWGWVGLAVGVVGTFLLTVLIGVAVRAYMGGSVPQEEREKLIDATLTNHRSTVEEAYPDAGEDELREELSEDLESVVERATEVAPSNEEIWFERTFVQAAMDCANRQQSEERRRLFNALGMEIKDSWF